MFLEHRSPWALEWLGARALAATALPVRAGEQIRDVSEEMLGGTPLGGIAGDGTHRRRLARQTLDECEHPTWCQRPAPHVEEIDAVEAQEIGLDGLAVLG